MRLRSFDLFNGAVINFYRFKLLQESSGILARMIFAFYGNHKPNGVGLSYQLQDESECALFADMFEVYKKQYEDADAAGKIKQIEQYEGQLMNHKKLIGRSPGYEVCLIANIWFLEFIG